MDKIALGAKVQLAKMFFFDYCHLIMPSFYKRDRKYLQNVCTEFQGFLNDNEHDVLVLNMPPRHGKSLTLGKFVEWVLGNDHSKKIMTGSYNETLSTVFSKNVRNTIQEVKADENKIVYSDIFNAKIKYGDGAMNLWSLEDGYNNYLATSPTGTATGFGADIIIIDDVIKNAKEANNATTLNDQWEWFINTMLSRLESKGKIIINMTRWHSNDLAGKVLKELPKSGYRVKHINFKACDEETHQMLCDDVLSYDEYQRKVKTMGQDIALANYQQQPIDLKGRLYQKFQTYETESTYIKRWVYTDTADRGEDYLCSIAFGETEDHTAEVLDVLYTKKPMEDTEIAHANQAIVNRINHVRVESNSGGRGFSRNSERIAKEKGYRNAYYEPFHQSDNKQSRILSNSALVENLVYFPEDWAIRWPEFYEAITTFQREGKNKHDDAPDALTGVVETINEEDDFNFIQY
ncbi:phage terminase, large subunit [Enterococcus sp. AZ194]|uniref:phage terminase large subunit n=1 Tax=Enterococcus sp. AZ194 TaxID=2774629 RepID=UPI003F29F250